MIKNDTLIIYDSLYYAIENNTKQFTSISAFLSLAAIKKLTSKISSNHASKLFGLLVPMLTLHDGTILQFNQ